MTQIGLAAAADSCASGSFCVAVGTGASGTKGYAAIFSDGSWQPAKSIDGNAGVGTVSCAPSTSFCVAGGDDGSVETYAKGSWSAPRLIDPTVSIAGDEYQPGIESVSCATPSFCVAVDDYGQAISFDGKSWSLPRPLIGLSGGEPEDGSFRAVSCASTSFCLAIGRDGTTTPFPSEVVSVAYGRGGWGPEVPFVSSAGSGPDEALSCASSTFCMGITEEDQAWVYRAGGWGPATTVAAPTAADDYALQSISCASSSFCLAGDRNGDALTYNGRSWTQATPDPGNWLLGMSCPSTSFCLAVGNPLGATYTGTPTSTGTSSRPPAGWKTDWAGPKFCRTKAAGYQYLGSSWHGVAVCGAAYPNNDQGRISYNGVTFDTVGFQCVELAERYFYYLTGQAGPFANGSDLAEVLYYHYRHADPNLGLYPTGARGRTSSYQSTLKAGDIISLWSDSDSAIGHVGVVIKTALHAARHGKQSGTITVLDENASANGQDTLEVNDGRMYFPNGGYTYFQWLYGLPA